MVLFHGETCIFAQIPSTKLRKKNEKCKFIAVKIGLFCKKMRFATELQGFRMFRKEKILLSQGFEMILFDELCSSNCR
jgi:hypothetical protein